MAVKKNADGTVTVDLEYPIMLEGETVKAVTLKRLKGAQFRKVDLASLTKGEDMLRLIGQLASLPPSSCDMLDGADITALTEVVTDFFGKSRSTGAA